MGDDDLPILDIVTRTLASWRVNYNTDPAKALADAGSSLEITLAEGAIDFAKRLDEIIDCHRDVA